MFWCSLERRCDREAAGVVFTRTSFKSVGMDEPKMAETFNLLKKRDLVQTYCFKKACLAFGPPKCRKRILIAPPMPKGRPRTMYSGGELRSAAGGRSQSLPDEKSFRMVQEEKTEYTEWLNKRRDFRKALDGLGNLDPWFYNKPNLTQMESNVMERRKEKLKNTMTKELFNEVHGGKQSKKTPTHNEHVQINPVGGPTGCAVDHFRTRCMEEYLSCLKQCQNQGLSINQAALKRVLLHPEDVSTASALPGHEKGRRSWMSYSILPQKEMEDDDNIEHKDFSPCADSNAFWPGHNDHVRLYLPVKSNRHESVLFSHVEHNAVPCPGHWPINRAGYYTSGDIDRHKVYTL